MSANFSTLCEFMIAAFVGA